jgi:hypothetical protein
MLSQNRAIAELVNGEQTLILKGYLVVGLAEIRILISCVLTHPSKNTLYKQFSVRAANHIQH